MTASKARGLANFAATIAPVRGDGSNEPAVSCRGLGLAYGNREVLADLDLSIMRGRHVAIMGPSGSGKTTLLHVLAGLRRPDAGQVTVAGLDLSKAKRADLAGLRQRSVAMVFQFGELLPELRVGENVSLPLLMRGDPVDGKVIRRTLEAVGLEDLDAWPAQLSGGETQRVAVARALVTNPAVILCDEPTGALDAANSTQVVELLKQSARRTGATLVVSTHDPSAAGSMDEVYHLANGRLERRA